MFHQGFSEAAVQPQNPKIQIIYIRKEHGKVYYFLLYTKLTPTVVVVARDLLLLQNTYVHTQQKNPGGFFFLEQALTFFCLHVEI